MAACESPKSTIDLVAVVSPKRHGGWDVAVYDSRHPSTSGAASLAEALERGGIQVGGDSVDRGGPGHGRLHLGLGRIQGGDGRDRPWWPATGRPREPPRRPSGCWRARGWRRPAPDHGRPRRDGGGAEEADGHPGGRQGQAGAHAPPGRGRQPRRVPERVLDEAEAHHGRPVRSSTPAPRPAIRRGRGRPRTGPGSAPGSATGTRSRRCDRWPASPPGPGAGSGRLAGWASPDATTAPAPSTGSRAAVPGYGVLAP